MYHFVIGVTIAYILTFTLRKMAVVCLFQMLMELWQSLNNSSV